MRKKPVGKKAYKNPYLCLVISTTDDEGKAARKERKALFARCTRYK